MIDRIERLQAQFYGLSLDQKRGFIESLQDELHRTDDAEWMAYLQPFVSQCIMEYNEEIKRPPAERQVDYHRAEGPGYDSGSHSSAVLAQGNEVLNNAVGNAKMAYEASRGRPPLLTLSEGEQVVRGYHCIKKGLIFQVNGYMTVTNRRIIFQAHSMFTKATTEVPLDSIDAIYSGVVRFSLLHLLIGLFSILTAIVNASGGIPGFGGGFYTFVYLVIAAIFLVIAFWPRVSIVVCSSFVGETIRLNRYLGNKSNFTYKGRPGRDTMVMFQELGAMITDLQKLGDAAVRKWGS